MFVLNGWEKCFVHLFLYKEVPQDGVNYQKKGLIRVEWIEDSFLVQQALFVFGNLK